MPVALTVYLAGTPGWRIHVHGCSNGNELPPLAAVPRAKGDGERTMADAKIQKIMDRGRETMYLTRPVKFSKRKMLPASPQAREMALHMISLHLGCQHLVGPRRASPGSRDRPSRVRYTHTEHVGAFRKLAVVRQSHPPGRGQRGHGQDIGQWPDGGAKEGYGGGSKPPRPSRVSWTPLAGTGARYGHTEGDHRGEPSASGVLSSGWCWPCPAGSGLGCHSL